MSMIVNYYCDSEQTVINQGRILTKKCAGVLSRPGLAQNGLCLPVLWRLLKFCGAIDETVR